jgi:UMF1 family MFS transporter
MSSVENKNEQIKGFYFYDWGKSAFETSVTVAILPVWFSTLFLAANGIHINFGEMSFTSDTIWSFAVFSSALIVALTSPIMGAIADRTKIKMLMLRIFTYVGAGATLLMGGALIFGLGVKWIWLLAMFILANVGLNGAGVFYNAILPHLGDDDEMDEISNTAYAYGYLGGGILLVIHLALLLATSYADWAIAFSLSTSGIWWYGFALITFKNLKEPEIKNPVDDLTFSSALALAGHELGTTIREIRSRFKVLFLYMLSYFFFIDGINSVTSLAGVFGPSVLGIGLIANMIVIIMVQFIAAPAAICFTKLSEKTGTKKALTIACVGWCVVIVGALGFAPLELENHDEYDIQYTWVNTDNQSGYYTAAINEDTINVAISGDEQKWVKEWVNVLPTKMSSEDTSILKFDYDNPNEGQYTNFSKLQFLINSLDNTRFSVSVSDGPLDGKTNVGIKHPTNLGDEALDTIPSVTREYVWSNLGITVFYQWMILGLMAGCLLGGSQGLSRSMFGQMVPETKSAEFFGFFGFFGKVAALLGPLLYGVVGTLFGSSRAGLASIGSLIVIGTFLLTFVDVEEGIRVAKEVDEEYNSALSEEE